jgi:membrane associated rhomboid family serine protease
VVAGTAILSIAVTAAWWSKLNVSPLFPSAMIRRGELWRLLTAVLPHVDALHLIFNVYWLWVFGSIVEQVYGHFKTALLIVLFAFGSGALEFAFSDGGVGLSGVGYGLFGLLWVLSRHDERFSDAVDNRTVQLFVFWFFFCIVTTWLKIFQVANIAHGTGAVLGLLTGTAIALPQRRTFASVGVFALLLFGWWGATIGRPRINVSGSGGYEEAQWGFDALLANRNTEAARWFDDAVMYRPQEPDFWYDLGIAYQRLGNKARAQAAYQRAVQLNPNQSDFSEALKELN